MKNTLLILLLSITTFLNTQITDIGLLAYYNFDNDTNNQISGSTQFDLASLGIAPAITTTPDCINGTNCVTFNGTGALVTNDCLTKYKIIPIKV